MKLQEILNDLKRFREYAISNRILIEGSYPDLHLQRLIKNFEEWRP